MTNQRGHHDIWVDDGALQLLGQRPPGFAGRCEGGVALDGGDAQNSSRDGRAGRKYLNGEYRRIAQRIPYFRKGMWGHPCLFGFGMGSLFDDPEVDVRGSFVHRKLVEQELVRDAFASAASELCVATCAGNRSQVPRKRTSGKTSGQWHGSMHTRRLAEVLETI